MRKAKGQLKSMSNGTSHSPFPKRFGSIPATHGKTEGDQHNTRITKRPKIAGQK